MAYVISKRTMCVYGMRNLRNVYESCVYVCVRRDVLTRANVV